MTSSDTDATELKLNLISLRTGKNVCLHFNNDGKTRFYTEDIGLAGDLIQSLVQFLNVENMNVSKWWRRWAGPQWDHFGGKTIKTSG